MKRAYLTIDDSPSERTDDLVDFLNGKNIPALLFCRGDHIAQRPEITARAIQKGMVVGNHTYSHKRASELTFEQEREEILKTEREIDAAYKKAGAARPGKYFRFSYMDRGTGAWVVDFDAAPQYKSELQKIFWEGLNFSNPAPSVSALVEKKERLQEFLKAEGFTIPFEGVTHEWYARTEIARAADCFFTYSTSDWMLTKRHLEKNWPYKTIEDLKRKIDEDDYLAREDSAHIILIHDQPEIFGVFAALIDHFKAQNFEFLDFQEQV